MSLTDKIPTATSNDEMSTLLEILTNTGRRLEELTAGQVDTAGDYDGRMLLLRGTREQLKRSELAKQAAILDALPANIALLDVEGIISSVNSRWSLNDIGAIQGGPDQRIGQNYLEICSRRARQDAVRPR